MNQVIRTSVPSSLLGALVATITHACTLEALARPLLELLQSATGMESAYLTRLDEAAGVLYVTYARNTHRLTVPEGLSVPWSLSLSKRAMDEGRFYTDDVLAHWPDCELARTLGMVSYMTTPIRSKSGELFGTLCATSDEHRARSEAAVHLLTLFAQLIAQEMERERLLGALQLANSSLATTALVDPMTQLPNRRALVETMQQRLMALSGDQAFIVAMIDLDNLKSLNDQFGHASGDQLVQAVAKRLQRMLRDGDIAARVAADAFAVLAIEQRTRAGEVSAALTRRLENATRGRFKLDSALIDYEGAAVGAIVAEPGCANAQELLDRAAAAVKLAKRTQKIDIVSSISVVKNVARYAWPIIE